MSDIQTETCLHSAALLCLKETCPRPTLPPLRSACPGRCQEKGASSTEAAWLLHTRQKAAGQ